MGAPVNNDFWKLRSTHGAPIKYSAEELITIWNNFLDEISEEGFDRPELIKSGEKAGETGTVKLKMPITMKLFSAKTGIDENTIKSYCNADNDKIDKDLFIIATRICQLIESYIDSGCLTGVLNPAYGAKLRGLSDKQEINHTGESQSVNINIDGSKLDLTR
jgi:hypothetical protein